MRPHWPGCNSSRLRPNVETPSSRRSAWKRSPESRSICVKLTPSSMRSASYCRSTAPFSTPYESQTCSARGRASGAERQPARTGAKADLGERGLPQRAHDGLAVDLLERDASDAAGLRVVGERLQRGADAGVVGGNERLQRSATALEVEDRLGAGEHDKGAGRARGAAAGAGRLALAPGPRQRRAVRLRRVGRGEHERLRLLGRLLRAQALDRTGKGKLGAAEPLDEVAAAGDAERLELCQLWVDGGEAAGNAFSEHQLAGE